MEKKSSNNGAFTMKTDVNGLSLFHSKQILESDSGLSAQSSTVLYIGRIKKESI